MIKSPRRYTLPLLILLLFITGCAPVISRQTQKEVDKTITFVHIKNSPSGHRGTVAILGGRIIKIINQSDITLIEVFQLPLSPAMKPLQDKQKSQGRFLILRQGFIDPAEYMNKLVTVAGPLGEPITRPLDKTPYRYPVIVPREFHLWQVGEERKPLVIPNISGIILGNQ